jgi:dolichyl-phosphate beta-glucosyltransferase
MNTCVIVVPCYNEANRLNIDEFKKYLLDSPDTSILFVNDGSSDATLELLQRALADVPAQIQVLHLEHNSGKGEAVRIGMLHALQQADASYIGFWDADLATPLAAIGDLLQILSSHPAVEIVLGSRVRLLGRDIERFAVRHYLGRVFATCASLVLELPVYDTQCGAKLFRATSALADALEKPFCSRWVFDVEMIARFAQLHSSDPDTLRNIIYEFPLYRWKDVPGSKLRARDFFRAAKELLIIRRNYFPRPWLRPGLADAKRGVKC